MEGLLDEGVGAAADTVLNNCIVGVSAHEQHWQVGTGFANKLG